MFSGGLISQLIGLVTIPVVTRLYAPELYGEYSIYIQLIIAISIALSFRYEHLLLLSSSHTMAVNNLKNILLISLVGVLVVPIVMLGNIDIFEQYYEVALDSNIVLILVVSGFVTVYLMA
jgi:O-antigen/teichoic acid export membrane protein